jgi:hypothetical protein
MDDIPKFTFAPGGSYESVLPNDVPWSDDGGHASRIAWRCAVCIPPGSVDRAQQFVDRLDGHAVWGRLGYKVHLVAKVLKSPSASAGLVLGFVVLVNLWVEIGRMATARTISDAEGALEAVREQVSISLCAASDLNQEWSLSIRQEFAYIRLPTRRQISTQNLWSALASLLLTGRREVSFPTLSIAGNTVRFGPEPLGAIDALRKFLAQERMGGDARDPTKPSHSAWIAPLSLAGLMLLAWLVPISWPSVLLTSLLLAGMFAYQVQHTLAFGRRGWWERPPVVSSLGLFGIAVFGLGYAFCWLRDPNALPDAHSLGYAFLVSVGVGVAGGVIGDHAPAGSARVLAHIELLLYLGGIAAIVALLLNLRRPPAEGR